MVKESVGDGVRETRDDGSVLVEMEASARELEVVAGEVRF